MPTIYVADLANNRVFRVGPEGIVTIFAGTGEEGFSGDGGPAVQAQLRGPVGVAVDIKGNVYIADHFNHRIRRVGPDGAITTFAGSGPTGEDIERIGERGFFGDGGPATQAFLNFPSGMAVDAKGNVYIADWANHRIRRVWPDGAITTFAGSGPTGEYEGDFSGDGGLAAQAQLNNPTGVAVDAKGNVYIADSGNDRIRRVEATETEIVMLSLLTYDNTKVGSTSQRTFTISNPSSESLSVTGITVGGTDAAQFNASPTTATIVAGQSQTVTVTFLPTSGGIKSAVLSIAHNASGSPSAVALSGTGFGPGDIMAFAGGGTGGDGGPAVQASLNAPEGVAVDAKGNLYIADQRNHRIRRVGPDGVITTFAGTGREGFSGDGGPAVQASLNAPFGVAVDANGVVYIADQRNDRIRRVGPDGIITTFAGAVGPGFSGDRGPAVQAQLSGLSGVAVDAKGNIYIISNLRVRRVGPDGIITTFAGGGTGGLGDGGPAVQAQLSPSGVAVDAKGNVYIADYSNSRIRRVGPDGIITTIAGTGTQGFSGDGGPAVQAQLNLPTGVAVDAKGNVYIADYSNSRIRRVGPDGIITTFAGTDTRGFSGDRGPAVQARLNSPRSVAVDAKGNVYIADYSNSRIRRVGPDGIITTFAGTGSPGFSGDGGPAVQAQLYNPSGMAVDANGVVYIADRDNDRIRRVGPDGMITTFAGTGFPGFSEDGIPAVQARLFRPVGVAVDAKGNIYISDTQYHRIRRVGPDSIITTLAGTGTKGFSGDGGPAVQAQLNFPTGVVVDANGNVYISDNQNHRVRRVGTDGIVTTFAGTGTKGFSGDGGPAAQAQLNGPISVAVDPKGNIYIADWDNFRIRRVEGGSLTEVSSLASDFDGNGEVGFDDFFAFAGAFGQKATSANTKYDLDRDGEVGFGDFFIFAGDFGKTIKSGKATALFSTR